MNLSKRDQKLILMLLGLAVFLAAYLSICKPLNNKKADMAVQITTLQAQVDLLNSYAASTAAYQGEINKIGDKISAELSKYPGDIRSEDLIMYTTELEEKIGISADNISISSPEVVSKLSLPEKSGDSYELVPMAVIKTGLTVNCTMSYAQMKALLDYVNKSSGKASLADVTVNYDSSSGKLLGTVTINKYFIASANYSYSKTSIPAVALGTDDPFGTLAVSPSPSPDGTN